MIYKKKEGKCVYLQIYFMNENMNWYNTTTTTTIIKTTKKKVNIFMAFL